MASNFNKLLRTLQKKQISLPDYQDYLKFCTTTSFATLSQYLKKQNIELIQYFNYLQQSENNLPQTTTLKNSNTLILRELGARLLAESKVDLNTLNTVLAQLPDQKWDPKTLLQHLFRARKISIDDFIKFTQKSRENSVAIDSIYGLRSTGETYEFFRENSLKNKTLGPYEVLEELGSGGMGMVYKAYHASLNQTIALKTLLAGEQASEKTLKRFHREVSITAKLNHPNIIQILDSGIEGKINYFAMELVEGESLHNFKRQQFSLRDKLFLIQKILEALHYAHNQGVIHRDLKLENILITPEKEPKILDFGLAKDVSLTKESQKLTHSGAILGTAQYMSPEQANGETNQLDGRTDIYSVGVCLYLLLTGKFPHESKSIHQLLYQIIHNDPPFPSKFNKEIHPDLETILLKSLEKSPTKRYQTAKAFALDLEKFLNGYPILARPVSSWQKLIKWKNRNQKKVRLFALIGIICCLFIFSIIRDFRQESQNYVNEVIQKASKSFKESQRQTKLLSNSQQIQNLLNAFSQLNHALTIFPHSQKAEHTKWEIGQALLKLAYHSKSYQLAEFVIKEIERLPHIPQSKRSSLLAQLDAHKTKEIKTQEKRFQFWLEFLRNENLHEREVMDAIFEISRMTHNTIIDQLIPLLKEANEFYLKTPIQSSMQQKKVRFYEIIVRISGRTNNPKIAKELAHNLKIIGGKMIRIPKGRRSFAHVNYMVLLAQALANLKAGKYFKLLERLHVEMGNNSIFSIRVLSPYRKLVALSNESNIFSSQEKTISKSEEFTKRGFLKKERGDYQGALADYNQALKLNPQNYQVYVNRGLIKQNMGDFKGAIQDFTKGLEINPRDYKGYVNRGLALELTGDLAGALKDFNKTILLRPNNDTAYLERGNIKKIKGDLKGALADFNKTLENNPQLAVGYMNRGIVKELLLDFKGSLKDYNQAILLNPNQASAYLNRSSVKFNMNNYNGAIKDLDKAILLRPKYGTAYCNRANIKFKSKDLKGAIQDCNEAIYINPNHQAAYFIRALAQEDFGNKKEALKDYSQVILLGSNHLGAYFQRGKLYFLMQQKKQAKQDFLRFLEIGRRNPSPMFLNACKLIYKLFPELRK